MTTPHDTPKALEGYRVLDLADERGSYCGKLLADLVADVIKVEPPSGNHARDLGPFWHGTPHRERSLVCWFLNTSKRGITLDIEHHDGRDLFRRLAKTADAVIETFQPGHLDSLGLGFDDLRKVNEKVVLTSITGFGQTGPYKDFKSDEMIAMAMGGVMHSNGVPVRPPVRSRMPLMSYLSSMHAAQGTLMALRARKRTGKGQHVDISMQETASTMLCEFGVNSYLGPNKFYLQRWYGGDRPRSIPFGNYPCKDGYVSLIITRPAHWTQFVQWCSEVTGNTEILDEKYEGDRGQHIPVLRPIIEDFSKRFTKAELYAEGQKRHLTFVQVSTTKEVAEHKQLEARHYWQDIEHPELGAKVRYPGAPYMMTSSPSRIRRRPPLLGEHNEEVYCKESGLTKADLAALQEARVV
ncbi:MAG: CoA transferase [Chloroflexi bacterium]|nr:CoA transferase [Chloroflexota bacterium]